MNKENLGQNSQQGWILIFLCWLISMAALFGSLFMSGVMGLEPCVLCWWQRIFIYPLAIIFLVALLKREGKVDRTVVDYTLPLALIGFGFAIYHKLVYLGVIPESLQPCSKTLSCAEVNLEIMGFITIPILSIFAYSAIVVLLIVFKKRFS